MFYENLERSSNCAAREDGRYLRMRGPSSGPSRPFLCGDLCLTSFRGPTLEGRRYNFHKLHKIAGDGVVFNHMLAHRPHSLRPVCAAEGATKGAGAQVALSGAVGGQDRHANCASNSRRLIVERLSAFALSGDIRRVPRLSKRRAAKKEPNEER